MTEEDHLPLMVVVIIRMEGHLPLMVIVLRTEDLPRTQKEVDTDRGAPEKEEGATLQAVRLMVATLCTI